ncbi:hypothetical protein EDB80DRAFT_182641 [Ilyonectria destructans]|nr:hypothetical protein EDB80DRAFT_182641 [Ilyonectria destructans]
MPTGSGDGLQRVITFCTGKSFQDPFTVLLPKKRSRPIAKLPIQRGYSCKKCDYLTINQNDIMGHCNQLQHRDQRAGEKSWMLQCKHFGGAVTAATWSSNTKNERLPHGHRGKGGSSKSGTRKTQTGETSIPSSLHANKTGDRTAAAAEDSAQYGRKLFEANRQSVTGHIHTPPV